MSKEQPLRLHLGGEEVKEGWKIVNIQAKPGVDFVGDCRDLSQFADGSVTEVYASHVYEHLGYQTELPQALKEAYRVLKKWGVLRISVPNLEFLCQVFTAQGITPGNRFELMRIFMGGQIDPFDFHKTMFDMSIMSSFLNDAGFKKVNRVQSFGLFKDTSNLQINGYYVSLNVVAIKEE
jgi:predicted SAM-dependent methyltransferase